MIPTNWKETFSPPITTGDWTGDVWKLAFEVVENNSLSFNLLELDHGIGVLRFTNSKPKATIELEKIKGTNFNYFVKNSITLSS